MNQVTISTTIEKLEMIKPTKDTAPTYLVHKVDTDLVTSNYALPVYTNGKSMTNKMLVSRTDKKFRHVMRFITKVVVVANGGTAPI